MIRLCFFLNFLLIFLTPNLWAHHRCEDILKKHRMGAQFLHQKNPDLHNMPFINQITRLKAHQKLNPSSLPVDKISAWLDHIENTHLKKAISQEFAHGVNSSEAKSRFLSKIKDYYFRQFIIHPSDVPESYFEYQQRIGRERGSGEIVFTDTERQERINYIIAEQKISLGKWLDFFFSEESSHYPTWAKYWCFKGLVKLGSYDKKRARFTKRTPSTVGLFPELNKEALAYVMDAIVKKANKESLESIQDPLFLKLLEKSDFGALYTQAVLRKLDENLPLTTVKGEWVHYHKDSDYRLLFESLQGKFTGWCINGEMTARSSLSDSEIYVYYSFDRNGVATNPRLAIVKDSLGINEVVGIGPNQTIDAEIAKTSILDEKIKEFGTDEGDRYKKTVHHMSYLTAIEGKLKEGVNLTLSDLRFLYEIDEPILSFGEVRDPRIEEFVAKRNSKEDLSLLLGIPEEKISKTEEEALSGNILLHEGDLDLSQLQSGEGLNLPKIVIGQLNLSGLKSIEGLNLPNIVRSHLDLSGLESAEGLILPKTVGGDLNLGGLKSAQGLTLPQIVGGSLYLGGLESAEGLILPKTVGGDLNLGGLKSAQGLTLPQIVGGYLDLGDLKSAQGLTLPKTVGEYLYLGSLQSAQGLILPKTLRGSLELGCLQSAQGLTLPKTLWGNLNLGGLKSAQGLAFPQIVGGNVNLGSLESAEGVTLPDFVKGNLSLSSLKSAQGLTFPQTLGGSLFLGGLESSKGLKLPKAVWGELLIGRLEFTEGLIFPDYVGGNLTISKLQTTKGLTLPNTVGGYLIISGPGSREELTLPSKFGGKVMRW